MKKHLSSIVLSILLIFNFGASLAQQQSIDSLKQVLFDTKDGQSRVRLMNSISQAYTYINIDSASFFVNEAYKTSQKLRYSEGLAVSFNRIGLVNFAKGDFNEALIWLDSAYQLQKKLGNLEKELSAINNLGMTYTQLGADSTAIEMNLEGLRVAEKEGLYNTAGSFSGNMGYSLLNKAQYDSARAYYIKSADYFKRSNNIQNQSLLTNNIGTTYHYQAEYAKALIYYKESLELARSIGFERVITLASNSLALIYQQIDSPVKAIEYALPVLASYQKSGLKREEGELLHNIAILYEENGSYDEAIDFGLKAIKIHEAISSYFLSNALSVVGKAYYHQGEKELGLQFLTKAFDNAVNRENQLTQIEVSLFLAQDLASRKLYSNAYRTLIKSKDLLQKVDSPEDAYDLYSLLAEVSKELGYRDDAYSYIEISKVYLDSIRDEKQINALMRSAIEFETEKKEQELLKVEQESAIKDLQVKEKSFYLVLSIIGLVLIILIAFTLYLFAKHRRQQLLHRNQLMEQRLLRVQLNPHFIFNALMGIQDYMLTANTKNASKFLANFSRLMRQTLDSSRSEFILLSQEIEMLEDYLILQQLRKPFGYSITYQDGLELDRISIPPMFAQPFVENAVEHGLSDHADDNQIHVHFELESNSVVLTIIDNGVGLKATASTKKYNHESLATTITEERIVILKENLKRRIAFKVEELKQGTRVVFHLPYEFL